MATATVDWGSFEHRVGEERLKRVSSNTRLRSNGGLARLLSPKNHRVGRGWGSELLDPCRNAHVLDFGSTT
jgi:hypothetical protein